MNQHPQKSNLYRLPWSTNDNPIGWMELTDICNIKCQGCYRLVMGEGHKPFDQVKEEILFLKKWRNCDNISLAGGEPVLHPEILEIVSFISSLKMKSIMLTNGYALNEAILLQLKHAGLTGISFHIDSTQTRPEFKKEEIKSELELNPLRLRYARLVKKYGFYAHFGITVTADSLSEVPQFIQWCIDHSRLVSGISLILYRSLPVHEGVSYYANNRKVDLSDNSLGYALENDALGYKLLKSQEVYQVIKAHFPDYDASSYLGGTHDHTSIKWLIGNIIVNAKGKTFGAFGKKTLELAQVAHHWLFGSYLVYPRVKMGKRVFFMSLFDRRVRKAFYKFMGYVLGNPLRFFHPLKSIGIGIIQAPDVMPDGNIDMCDDCPDMCVFEGRLVNSCRLDECRKYGDLLHVHYKQDQQPKREETLVSRH